MSLHKKYAHMAELNKSLAEHRLPHDVPSQPADFFRSGWLAHMRAKPEPEMVSHSILDYGGEVFVVFDPTDNGASIVGAYRFLDEAIKARDEHVNAVTVGTDDARILDWLLPNLHPANFGIEFNPEGLETNWVAEFKRAILQDIKDTP